MNIVLASYVIVAVIAMFIGIYFRKGLFLSLLLGIFWPIMSVIALFLLIFGRKA